MGTGAYLLFTLDRLIASAMKQLVTLVHDPSSVRLRSLWEYVQARIALARGTLPPADGELGRVGELLRRRGVAWRGRGCRWMLPVWHGCRCRQASAAAWRGCISHHWGKCRAGL
jgi:hypothetical protein